jgi:hypothetical protein
VKQRRNIYSIGGMTRLKLRIATILKAELIEGIILNV